MKGEGYWWSHCHWACWYYLWQSLWTETFNQKHYISLYLSLFYKITTRHNHSMYWGCANLKQGHQRVCLLLSKRTARPQGQIHPELGSWPYLAFMAFEIKIIFAVVNSMDKMSLQFKFDCNWSIGSREKPLFAIDFLGIKYLWFLSASVWREVSVKPFTWFYLFWVKYLDDFYRPLCRGRWKLVENNLLYKVCAEFISELVPI